jgi:hypothetical protein
LSVKGVMKAGQNHWVRLLGWPFEAQGKAKLPLSEGDDLGELVAAVAEEKRQQMLPHSKPVEREEILAAFPGAIFHVDADACI